MGSEGVGRCSLERRPGGLAGGCGTGRDDGRGGEGRDASEAQARRPAVLDRTEACVTFVRDAMPPKGRPGGLPHYQEAVVGAVDFYGGVDGVDQVGAVFGYEGKDGV